MIQTTPIPKYTDVHPGFRLNGFNLDRDDLCRIAYSFIKEGEPYEKWVGMFLLDWFDKNETVEIQTSGSTGKPKIVSVSKQAMVNSALATGSFFELSPGNRVLHCLPAKYIAGKMMFVRSFILGLDMDFVEPDAHPLKNNEQKYDFAAMVPLQAQNSLPYLRCVKKLILGGVGISKSLEEQLVELPTEIYETYGMTETITHIAAKRVGADAFTALPGVTLSCNDDKCLIIHAPHVSAEAIQTNDVVEIVGDNQFVFLGRADNIVNSGGIKLIPELIEGKVSEKKIGSRFIFAGLPDELLGQKLVLLAEGEPREIDPSAFGGLDKYERPREIHFIPRFAETGNGKILRSETVAML